MGLEFEGALDNVNKIQLDFIRDVLEKRGYRDTKVTVENVGAVGDNYMASVKRTIVRNEHGEFRMIVKMAPQELSRKTNSTTEVFKNEHIMYTKVLPRFRRLQDQADVAKEDRLRFAECYGSLTQEPYEVILLEDLQVPGFVMMNRFNPLSDECVKSVLRNFAIFHSLSYALKHKEMETFNAFKEGLFDMWSNMNNDEDAALNFNHIEESAIMAVEGEDRKKILKGCACESLAHVAKLVKQDTNTKRSVIQQGDAWTNNMMFKFDGDELKESVMIDYQLSKEGNPIYDVMYLIFNCTDHKSLVPHFNGWIDYYHSELDKALSYYGLKANYVYPRDQLDADMKRYGRAMFGLSLIVLGIMLLQPEDALIIKEAMENDDKDVLRGSTGMNEKYLLKYRTRLEDVMDSYLKFGLL